MRKTLILAVTIAALVSGCGSAASTPASPLGHPSHSTANVTRAPARELCVRTFPRRTVLGWDTATVAQLRAYQFGGPIAHHPMGDAFRGTPVDHVGVWCLLKDATNASSLWGAVAGNEPRRAITVTGPGEGHFRGQMAGPPLVP